MKELKILFTHDLHDRIDSYDVLMDGEIKNLAGIRRLKTAIDEERDHKTLLLDGGDFSMGTLYQTIFAKEAASLRLLGELGYDATTLGNHEFEMGSLLLSQSLDAAREKADYLPDILIANLDLDNPEGIEGFERIKESLEAYPIKDYRIIERNGLRIGVFGLIGYEAISFSPMANMNFRDSIDRARDIVKELEAEDVDLIICLSHSGTKAKGISEDENLARKVPGIDLIISAHTHRELFKPLRVRDTQIVSCGKYGKYLGILDLYREDESGPWRVRDYELRLMDESVEEDRSLDPLIEEFKERIQADYLDLFGLEYDQVIGSLDFNFTEMSKFGKSHEEDILGNFLCDGYIDSIRDIEGDDYEEIDLAVVPVGEVRDSLTKGDIKVYEVFNVASLGMGQDGSSGYPLISSYLYGSDIKKAVELDSSIGGMFRVAQLHMAGVEYSFNPNRMLFNRTSKMAFKNGDEIEDEKLYRVVSSLYTGQMLNMVKSLTKGIISIVPRDKNGRALENLEDAIIYDGDRELKQWYAISRYIEKLENIPDHYNELKGRKVEEDDQSIRARLEKPNKLGKAVYGTGLALTVLTIAGIARTVTKAAKNKDKK